MAKFFVYVLRMAGGLTLEASGRKLKLYRIEIDVEPDDDWEPRYNIAPTQNIPVIRQDPEQPKRLGSRMRWGLIPF